MLYVTQKQEVTIYFISGLGADKRVFQKLQIPAHFKVVHVEWIKPNDQETSLEYVKRLASQIDSLEPFILIGVSFGGMLVSDLLNFLTPEKAIIISSFKANRLPWYYILARWTDIYRIAPYGIFKSGNQLTYWLFGAKKDSDKKLLRQIFKDTDNQFLKWAVWRILKWPNIRPNDKIVHIHGDDDKIIPIRYVQPDFIVKGGGHFMVYTDAEEVSHILTEQLIGNG